MPNFRPRSEYFREMKRYGVLDQGFDPEKDKFDVYDIDRRYWELLWWNGGTKNKENVYNVP